MLRFLGGKLVRLVLLLAFVSAISFALVSLSPIDPVRAYVGADAMRVGPEQRALIAERWGVDDPPLQRYGKWISQLVRGDLGTSLIFRQPVSQVIRDRFAASLWLMATAWVITGVVGYTMGIVAGAMEGSWVDKAIETYAFTLASVPTFWLALVMLMIFSVWLGWTPVGLAVPAGELAAEVSLAERLHHLVLPALTLGVIGIANVTLHTRQKLIDVMRSDYLLFARARGQGKWTAVWRHGLRNTALPAVTLQFALFSEIFGGAVLAEQVFAYPGLGRTTVQAGLRGDIPLLLGIVLFSTVFVFVGNATADVVYRLVDPKIRLTGRL